jgi:phosphoribosylanthranilate isomerase
VPVKVKICGVRSVDDARAAVRCGADFIGLNFHPPSPRHVDVETAGAIAAAVSETPLVGIFVDAARAVVEDIARRIGLWGLQFHGDEPPDWCRGFDRPTIKALCAGPGDDLAGLAASFETDYILVDSFVAGRRGGTGVALDPVRARALPAHRLFVAGGLRADTVAHAVRVLRPFAVDVASGVELAPGIKDHEEIERFIRCAKGA